MPPETRGAAVQLSGPLTVFPAGEFGALPRRTNRLPLALYIPKI